MTGAACAELAGWTARLLDRSRACRQGPMLRTRSAGGTSLARPLFRRLTVVRCWMIKDDTVLFMCIHITPHLFLNNINIRII